MTIRILAGGKPMRAVALVLALGLVAGCEEGAGPSFLKPKDTAGGQTAPKAGQSTKLVERDVEAPEVFQVTEAGLWDGRPSLGGVWVAHPDVTEPRRVIIRNSANGKFVIGALFRREREIPGPRIQASSDAAAALGMLAGAPVELNVTALVREATPEQEAIPTVIEEPQSEIAQSELDPIAGAAAAIEAAGPAPAKPAATGDAPPAALVASVAAATAGSDKPKPKPKPRKSALKKPYIQIGIFSVKANAEQTANQMRSAGMVPTVYEQSSNGKAFWRVVVGPAQNRSEANALLKKVKATGFSDAYFVTN